MKKIGKLSRNFKMELTRQIMLILLRLMISLSICILIISQGPWRHPNTHNIHQLPLLEFRRENSTLSSTLHSETEAVEIYELLTNLSTRNLLQSNRSLSKKATYSQRKLPSTKIHEATLTTNLIIHASRTRTLS